MDYTLSFNLTLQDGKTYQHKISFKTASSNFFGDVSGSIILTDLLPVVIKLESKDVKPPVVYSFQLQDTLFHLRKILENDYSLFAYVDKNSNGVYDFGNPYPFEYL